MNDNIRKILVQCKEESIDSDFHLPYVDQEKFAELIVRECASLAYDGPAGILEYFGVKDDK